MSVIGPGNIGALNIAGSFAGAQKTEAAEDRNKAESADRRGEADQLALTAQTLDDVGEADLTPERDPDGRLPYSASTSDSQLDEDEPTKGEPVGAPDAFGERGNVLDLEA